jgi:hypothetical protein
MVSVERLSSNHVEDILREVDPERRFSEKEISEVTSMLNDALSRYARSEKEYLEPTSIQLGKQVDALYHALKRLKLALPSPGQESLPNYLVDLGEIYAEETRNPHPGIKPRWGGYSFEDGGTAEWIEHYGSDQRLREMIDAVTQVLAWMDHRDAETLDNFDWIDRKPDMKVFERLDPDSTPPYARRPRHTFWLVGAWLPQIYEKTFGKKYGVSRSKDRGGGPGVRFVMKTLRHAGITTENGNELSPDTIIKYRQNWQKTHNYKRVLPRLDNPG